MKTSKLTDTNIFPDIIMFNLHHHEMHYILFYSRGLRAFIEYSAIKEQSSGLGQEYVQFQITTLLIMFPWP